MVADRQTYVTDIDVSPGTKRWDEITQNLMINSDHDDRYLYAYQQLQYGSRCAFDTLLCDCSRGHQNAMESIDNDDGSAYHRHHCYLLQLTISINIVIVIVIRCCLFVIDR